MVRRKVGSLGIGVLLTAVGAAALVPADRAASTANASTKSPAFEVTRGPSVATANFLVTYSGSGNFHTAYQGRPPNRGHKPDRNTAEDSSAQRWSLKFTQRLQIPTCQPGAVGDPCAQVSGPTSAIGPTIATGRVDHVHLDGIYKQLNARERCRLGAHTGKHATSIARIVVSYDAGADAFRVTADDPVATVLSLMPGGCPHGDSLDGLLDFYGLPGFSFNNDYGADRWFTSRTVVIPAHTLHVASQIEIPLSDTRFGTPPRHCDAQHPRYERCTTGGSWHGLLTLTRRPGSSGAQLRHVTRLHAPGSGRYRGRGVDVYVSGRSISLFAASFPCGRTSGRTSLDDIPIVRTKRGYRFHLRAYGSVTFANNHTDQNGLFYLAGGFSRNGRTVTGSLRTTVRYCGGTHSFGWAATR